MKHMIIHSSKPDKSLLGLRHQNAGPVLPCWWSLSSSLYFFWRSTTGCLNMSWGECSQYYWTWNTAFMCHKTREGILSWIVCLWPPWKVLARMNLSSVHLLRQMRPLRIVQPKNRLLFQLYAVLVMSCQVSKSNWFYCLKVGLGWSDSIITVLHMKNTSLLNGRRNDSGGIKSTSESGIRPSRRLLSMWIC